MTATIVARGPQIIIVTRESWRPFYEAERREIERIAGAYLPLLEHVGSTAIAGLAGKPVIDILAGARSLEEADAIAGALGRRNYIRIPFVPANGDAGQRLFFLKRPLENAEGVDPSSPGYNVHVVALDQFHQDSQLLFRDHLRKHPELVAEYARLKCELVGKIADYREYMPAKSAFIEQVLAAARRERGPGCKIE